MDPYSEAVIPDDAIEQVRRLPPVLPQVPIGQPESISRLGIPRWPHHAHSHQQGRVAKGLRQLAGDILAVWAVRLQQLPLDLLAPERAAVPRPGHVDRE